MEATAVDDGNGGKTGGIDLRQYIRDKAPGAFSSSFFKVLSLSTVRKDSAAEIEAAITGDRKNIPSDENAKHNIGAITGGVAATAAAGLGAWGGAKVGALCGSWGGPIGMFVGAGAGLLIGGLIGLCCG